MSGFWATVNDSVRKCLFGNSVSDMADSVHLASALIDLFKESTALPDSYKFAFVSLKFALLQLCVGVWETDFRTMFLICFSFEVILLYLVLLLFLVPNLII